MGAKGDSRKILMGNFAAAVVILWSGDAAAQSAFSLGLAKIAAIAPAGYQHRQSYGGRNRQDSHLLMARSRVARARLAGRHFVPWLSTSREKVVDPPTPGRRFGDKGGRRSEGRRRAAHDGP